MPTQMQGTAGVVRRRPTYVDTINAQRQFLPQIIANKANKELADATIANDAKRLGLEERNLGIAETGNQISERALAETARSNSASEAYNARNLDLLQRGQDFEKDVAQRQAGGEMLKLGLNLSGSSAGKGLMDRLPGGAEGTMGKIGGAVAPALTGGLAGYGAAKMFGGKNKFKGALFGAGAGLLSGFLGGNWGNWGSMGGSTLGGLAGGLFGR